MINKKIHRQITILNFLKEGTKTNKEILNHLKLKGHTSGKSNLSTDIKSLKDNGIKIDDTTHRLYTLFLDESNEYYSHFIKHHSMAMAYQKALEIPKDFMQFILFEPNSLEFNIDVFNEVFDAIKSKKEIQFNHLNFQTKKTKQYNLKPFVLKEYQNRWYVIGETDKGFRTFSLDRISKLKTTNIDIKINLERIEDQLRDTIGVSFNENEITPKIVKLKINNSQKEYIKTTPIFPKQRIIEETSNYFILQMFVGVTVELKQQILKYGSRIEVLEPPLLKDQIKAEIKLMREIYG